MSNQTYMTIIEIAAWIRANPKRTEDIKRIKSGLNFVSVNEEFQAILARDAQLEEAKADQEKSDSEKLTNAIAAMLHKEE